MKILIFGAGVLGSLYAARLKEAGEDVALVARGRRFQELKEKGVILEDFKTGKRTHTEVRVIEGMPREEYFDVCVVLVQKTQVASALESLSQNSKIPAFIFMNNTAEGPQEMIDVLGKERVLMGHANAGGELEGPVVHYMIAEKMPLGELDGEISDRLNRLKEVFSKAGFPVELSKNIDSWKKYHVALAVPFAYAMYAEGVCNFKLAQNREMVRKCWRGIKEAFQVLKDLGFPPEPPKFKWVGYFPEFIVVPLFQRMLKSKIADIGMARHLRNAEEEMIGLSKEFWKLAENCERETPNLDELKSFFPSG